MDQIKAGQFIAELRREQNLTQEQLGERLGVTNKTVSRWETGTYMPPIEALEVISKQFNVSINEIIAGERIAEKDFRKMADENIAHAWQDSAFSLKERQTYFKRRWIKAHILHYVLLAALVVIIMVFENAVLGYILGVAGIFILHNAKQAYVERKAFDSPKYDRSE